jgi:aminopeptidase N
MKPAVKKIALIALLCLGCGSACLCAVLAIAMIGGWIWNNPSTRSAALTPSPSLLPTYTVSGLSSETAGSPSIDSAHVGSAGIGDPYFPEMGNGGYDVLHYDLALKVDMAVEEISGVATIAARSLQPLGRFNLDLKGFDIVSIKVNGMDAAFSRERGEVAITPAAEIPSGGEFTIEVVYAGRPGGGEAYAGIDFLEGWNFYPDGVIVAGEPTGAETWYPSNNHPQDKATFTFHITVEKPFVVAANGVLKKRTDNGDDTWTYDWAMDDPMASYLATIAVSNFDIREDKSETGVAIRDYLDADIREDVEDSTAVLPDALDFFSSIFGPYPFDACGVVVHEVDLPFSLENQTLIVMGYTFADAIVVVHELAHQWYGDSVSVSSWKDIWLNEGFASYAEALWWEHTAGVNAMQEDLSRRYEYTDGTQMVPIGDPGPDHLFDAEVYNRGALTLHALRLKVGDPAFFRILQEWFLRYKNKNAGTADFIALAEEISNLKLDSFFQDWLYEIALPDIPELGLYS